MTDIIITECPHCKISIVIEALNCRIFRCGIYKHNNQQIHPHASKSECDQLFKTGAIYGCGKPFQVIGDPPRSVICDYI
jgi:hypothetical protein